MHKTQKTVRPVSSMPGSAYHKVGEKITEWLKKVPECNINTSSKSVCDSLKNLTLAKDEEIVSFDVSSLYTNVPLEEAIERCAKLLYEGKNEKPPCSKETFVTLTRLATSNVLISTHRGTYIQTDGLAMGSSPAPMLANGWLSMFDKRIQGNSRFYARFMDDILMIVKKSMKNRKLTLINKYHPLLKFTMETEQDGKLAFLDMLILHIGDRVECTWYNKPTDTGLVLNFRALAPKRYKRAVVSGFVHRIWRSCSSWTHIHNSLSKAKQILEQNQYPPEFYDPIIRNTISKLLKPETSETTDHQQPEDKPASKKHKLYLQYRGKCTDDFLRALK